jgi:hypothetical protein
MKLRNKKTGKLIDINLSVDMLDEDSITEYDSLEEFNKEWEDYEDKRYWYIDVDGEIMSKESAWFNQSQDDIGNKFDTREEAEIAVEKLKAITRLNKCGFKFEGYDDRDRANGGDIVIYAHINIPNNNLLEEAQPAMLKDLDLLFGGEE